MSAPSVPPFDQQAAETALKKSEHWFRTLAESTTAVIFVYDAERFTYLNRTGSELLGYSVEELQEMAPWDLSHPDDLDSLKNRIADRLKGKPVAARLETRLVTKDGRDLWVDISASIIQLDGGPAVLGTAVDITERKEVEKALFAEKERAQVTLASIGDGVVRTDAKGQVDYINPVAERLTGWTSEEAGGVPVSKVLRVVDEESRQPLSGPVGRCLETGEAVEIPGPTLLLRLDGLEFDIRGSVSPLRDPQGTIVGAVLAVEDVTDLRGMEREMSYLATHDPLTGVINRRGLEVLLERALESARGRGVHHAFCHLDIHDFKVINNTCGHPAGDQALKEVAGRLKSALRQQDILARLGDDEFGVLFDQVGIAEARRLTEALGEAVEKIEFTWNERRFDIGIAIGLVPIDADTPDPQTALRAADAACYVANEGGRNRIHEYRPNDSRIAEHRGEMQWIQRIHDAFDEDRFELYCQEIRALPSPEGEETSGCYREVLVRMIDSDGDPILPGVFIPAAERYRLMPALDRWVIRNCFSALSRAGLALGDDRFSINLSGQSLSDEGFLAFVLEEVERSEVDPRRLCFEITETAAVSRLQRATSFISVLRRRGCRFILDDFGTGLCSFAYLKNLTVDFLKIDGEFVRGMTESRVQRALVKSIHQIGRDLGLGTIAESVETEEAFEDLKSLGVGYVQGYWIDRPRPLLELVK